MASENNLNIWVSISAPIHKSPIWSELTLLLDSFNQLSIPPGNFEIFTRKN